MKVCVTAVSQGLDAEIDPRFGRAQFFVFVETETMDVESVKNPNVDATGGAGIRSAQLVADKGAKVVITGHVGPNAMQALEAAGIRIVTGVGGITVKEAVQRFLDGVLSKTESKGENAETGTNLKAEVEALKKKVDELEERVRRLEDR